MEKFHVILPSMKLSVRVLCIITAIFLQLLAVLYNCYLICYPDIRSIFSGALLWIKFHIILLPSIKLCYVMWLVYCCTIYVRKHILAFTLWAWSEFFGCCWISGDLAKKFMGVKCVRSGSPPTPKTPLLANYPWWKYLGASGFFSVSYAHLLTGITTLNFEL